MTEPKVGDIVRVSEDSIHWEMFQEFDYPPEGILMEIDYDMMEEPFLVEFIREENFLHDGGINDNVDCRYWIDQIDILESIPVIEPEDFVWDDQAIPEPRQRPENVMHVIDDHIPDIDFNNEVMQRYARLAREHARDMGFEQPIIRQYGDLMDVEEPNEER